MCEWGTTVTVEVTVPANLSRTGRERVAPKDVDSCIAPMVVALNAAGIATVASCCGHGRRPGNIALADGREMVIAPDYDTARKVEAAFPPIFDQPPGPTRGEINRLQKEEERGDE